MKRLYYFLFFVFVPIFVILCGGNEDSLIDTPDSSLKISGPIEIPKLANGLFIQHDTKIGNESVMTYCMEYDIQRLHSRWIAFRFDAITRQKDVSRPDKDPFVDDPKLSENYWIGGEKSFGYEYFDLEGNRQTLPDKNHSLTGVNQTYDRGHLCASADRLYSKESNEQTFYMTNMSPQISEFNQHFWVAFENHVQKLGRSEMFADTLYVVKGGTIDKVKINGALQEGTLGTVVRSNGACVVIPKYYYMALLCLRNDRFKALGFLMEHKEYPYNNSGKDVSNETMKTFAVSIDELEEFTGIDFFHHLPDNIENEVEATLDTSVWGL